MIQFLALQIKMGKLTLEQITEPKKSQVLAYLQKMG